MRRRGRSLFIRRRVFRRPVYLRTNVPGGETPRVRLWRYHLRQRMQPQIGVLSKENPHSPNAPRGMWWVLRLGIGSMQSRVKFHRSSFLFLLLFLRRPEKSTRGQIRPLPAAIKWQPRVAFIGRPIVANKKENCLQSLRPWKAID